MSDCQHTDFNAAVRVNHLEDTGRFIADVSIGCSKCGLPFEFIGMEPGMSMSHPTVSLDGTEARIPIAPQGSLPNPFQRMVHGKRGFDA